MKSRKYSLHVCHGRFLGRIVDGRVQLPEDLPWKWGDADFYDDFYSADLKEQYYLYWNETEAEPPEGFSWLPVRALVGRRGIPGVRRPNRPPIWKIGEAQWQKAFLLINIPPGKTVRNYYRDVDCLIGSGKYPIECRYILGGLCDREAARGYSDGGPIGSVISGVSAPTPENLAEYLPDFPVEAILMYVHEWGADGLLGWLSAHGMSADETIQLLSEYEGAQWLHTLASRLHRRLTGGEAD